MAFDVDEIMISLEKVDALNAAFVVEFGGQRKIYQFSSCRRTQAQCPIQAGPAQMFAAGTTKGTLKELKKALKDAMQKLKELEPDDEDGDENQRAGEPA